MTPSKKPHPINKYYDLFAYVLFFIALAIRLIYLWEDRSNPFYEYGNIDSIHYKIFANDFSKYGILPNDVFFWGPGYPFFLSFIYATFGNTTIITKIVQSIIGSLTCVLVYLIGKKLFKAEHIPHVAAMICCLYGPLIYFDLQIVSANLEVFLDIFAIYLLLASSNATAIWLLIVAGIVIGISTVTRGGIVLFVPFIVLWIFLNAKRKSEEYYTNLCQEHQNRHIILWTLSRTTAILIPMILIISPVTVRNVVQEVKLEERNRNDLNSASSYHRRIIEKILSRDYVSVSSNVGLNLYLGNEWSLRNINNVNHPLCFTYYKNLLDEPYFNNVTTASQHNQYFIKKALSTILKDPVSYIKLLGMKVKRLISGVEISRNSNIYADRKYSSIMSITLSNNFIAFPSGIIIPLGLTGMLLLVREWRKHFLLLSFVSTQCLFILSFFVTSRYRVPIIPIVAIYAVYALYYIYNGIRERCYKKYIASFILTVCFAILSNAYVEKEDDNHGAYEYNNAAMLEMREGNYDIAFEHYKKALDIDPNYAPVLFSLGDYYEKRHITKAAIKYYEKGLSIAPMDITANMKLGEIYYSTGNANNAINRFKEVLKYQPMNREARDRLASIYK
jgi:tetratricopeptide (TPR) repeat protein